MWGHDKMMPAVLDSLSQRERDVYLAAWLEGEGSFITIPPAGRRQPFSLAQIAAVSTDHDTIDLIHRLLGCGNTFGPYEPSAPGRVQWAVKVCKAEDVLAVIDRVMPYLNERRTAQAISARAAAVATIGRKTARAMPHGTHQMYTKGCRCDGCVQAERQYRKAYYHKNRHRILASQKRYAERRKAASAS